ncbi:hypothetical protein N7G274_007387 [Stereocaulon virgatum]|uniref:Thioredoxin domain-containing protein n=1 Tax=Stereocaulon virgatum TaxID=373712 RepID=A0ABR4A395_9LECA
MKDWGVRIRRKSVGCIDTSEDSGYNPREAINVTYIMIMDTLKRRIDMIFLFEDIVVGVRSPTDLDTLLLLSSSSRTPLLTLWTTSSCSSCRHIRPLLTSLIRSGAGESHGGVSFAEVEFDSPTLGEVVGRYMITSIPTLMAFSRGEAQIETRLMDVREMRDEAFLRLWIEDEAGRGGRGGKGGGMGVLGGLFGFGGKQ